MKMPSAAPSRSELGKLFLDSIPHTTDEAYIARQPILTARGGLAGYEILYRNTDKSIHSHSDGIAATASVIINAFLDFAYNELGNGKSIFINADRDVLLSEMTDSLPTGDVVIEILEDVTVDHKVIAAVERIKDMGYQIALDDWVSGDARVGLLPYADIVKVEISAHDSNTLPATVKLLKAHGITMLAEKVETEEQYRNCLSLGFEMFQGFFFSKPEVRSAPRLTSSYGSVLRLLELTHDANACFHDIAEVIRRDPALAHKVLQYVNSPLCTGGRSKHIDSIEHAASMLGFNKLRQLASIMSLSHLTDAPMPVFYHALVRARMCEVIAGQCGGTRGDIAFTVGLLSLMDILLKTPMEELVLSLRLSPQIAEALTQQKGRLGEILACTIASENTSNHSCPSSGCCKVEVEGFLEASLWADRVLEVGRSGD